jgi:hypothetical protein
LSGRDGGLAAAGVIICSGKGEDLKAGVGVSVPEGVDDHFHGGAGGEDVVNNKEGRPGGGGPGRVDGIKTFQFGGPLFPGELFDGWGDPGFPEHPGVIMAPEMMGESFPQFVQGGGGFFPGDGLVVMQGAEDGAAGGDVGGQHFQGTADPSVEVRLETPFEFQEAVGKRIFSRR